MTIPDKPLHELLAELDGNNGYRLPDASLIAERIVEKIEEEATRESAS